MFKELNQFGLVIRYSLGKDKREENIPTLTILYEQIKELCERSISGEVTANMSYDEVGLHDIKIEFDEEDLKGKVTLKRREDMLFVGKECLEGRIEIIGGFPNSTLYRGISDYIKKYLPLTPEGVRFTLG